MKVKCPKCNHTWKTKSLMMFITCPCCQRKFQIRDKKEKEAGEELPLVEK